MRTKCEQAKEQLLAALMRGRWAAGERLPGLPELARLYDVTAGTMERALRLLIAQGVLERQPKQGTFVREQLPDERFREAPIIVIGWGPEALDDFYTSTILKEIHRQLPGRNWIFLHDITSADIAFALHAFHATTVIALAPTVGQVEQLAEFFSADLQILCLGSRAESSRTHTISIDNAFGIAEGMRYLARLGHRRVAYISGSVERTDHIERYQAFRRYRSRYGFATDRTLLQWRHAPEGTPAFVADALDRWFALPQPPTAIFAGGGPQIFVLLQALRERHLRIPDDVSVIAYDDFPMHAYHQPPLTVIRQPLEEIGNMAVKALYKLAKPVHPIVHAVIKPALIVRESCTNVARASSP